MKLDLQAWQARAGQLASRTVARNILPDEKKTEPSPSWNRI